jgi:hypothetical protein
VTCIERTFPAAGASGASFSVDEWGGSSRERTVVRERIRRLKICRYPAELVDRENSGSVRPGRRAEMLQAGTTRSGRASNAARQPDHRPERPSAANGKKKVTRRRRSS